MKGWCKLCGKNRFEYVNPAGDDDLVRCLHCGTEQESIFKRAALLEMIESGDEEDVHETQS